MRSHSTADRRKALALRDGSLCGICGELLDWFDPQVHVDHIIPRSAGGRSALANLQLTHGICNMRKGGVRRPGQRRAKAPKNAAEPFPGWSRDGTGVANEFIEWHMASLTLTQLRLYLAINRLAPPEQNARAVIPLRTLAAMTGTQGSALMQALNVLEERRLIERLRRQDERGTLASEYRIASTPTRPARD